MMKIDYCGPRFDESEMRCREVSKGIGSALHDWRVGRISYAEYLSRLERLHADLGRIIGR